MKNKLFLLLISALSLTGCTIEDRTNTRDLDDETGSFLDDDDDNTGGSHSGGGNTEGDSGNTGTGGGGTSGGGDSGTGGGTETGGGTSGGEGSYQYSLDDYTNFYWHNGHKPCYAPNWEYHIKDTVNPLQSAFWENPNEKVDYSGVIFKDRNSYIISPTFKSWKKVEVDLVFWFSANNKECNKNDPQMYIEEYSSNDKLLGKEEIKIARSDVPNNNTPLKRTYYLRNESMSYFILRHNSYVYNGSGASFYVVLSEATLKGWNYD